MVVWGATHNKPVRSDIRLPSQFRKLLFWVCTAHSSCLLPRKCHFRQPETLHHGLTSSNSCELSVLFSCVTWLFLSSHSGWPPALVMNAPVLLSCTIRSERVWNVQLVLSIRKWTSQRCYNWFDIFSGHWQACDGTQNGAFTWKTDAYTAEWQQISNREIYLMRWWF